MGESKEVQAYGRAVKVEHSLSLATALRPLIGSSRLVSSAEYARSSGIDRLCPRKEGLKIHSPWIEEMDVVEPRLAWTFAYGTGIHHALQNSLLLKTDRFLGWWKCGKCNEEYRGTRIHHLPGLEREWISRPLECVNGCTNDYGEADLRYEELSFRNEEYLIKGHCDGVWRRGDDELEVLEFKTISSYGFKSVSNMIGEPKQEHLLQATVYMWMTGIDRARIVYLGKSDEPGHHPVFGMWSEFEFGLDENLLKLAKAKLKARMKAIEQAKAGEEVTVKRLATCVDLGSKRVVECAFRGVCFGE